MSLLSLLRNPWTAAVSGCIWITFASALEPLPAAEGRSAAESKIVSKLEADSPLMTWRPVTTGKADARRKSEPSPRNHQRQPVATVSHEYLPGETFNAHCDTLGCDTLGCDSMGVMSRQRTSFSIHTEYLLWSLDAVELPALVTTSPAGTTLEDTGRLDQSGTSILFGGTGVGDELRSGARVTLSWGNNPCGDGFELSGLGIFEDSESFRDGRALLARPVFDTGSNGESAMLIAHPDFLTGSVSVQVDSELYAFDALRRQRLCTSSCDQLDLLVGYRHGRLDESLRIDQVGAFTAAQGQIISGTTQALFDDFQAENRFHGAQIGLHYLRRCRSSSTFNAMAKLGFGVNQAKARINGQATNTVPGAGSSTFTGGLLAQSTNIGSYDESEFSVIPELGVMFTTRLDRYIDLSIGYNVIIWSNTLRVADMIDRNVSQFPPEVPSGTLDPSFQFETDTFIAHGLSFGALVSF